MFITIHPFGSVIKNDWTLRLAVIVLHHSCALVGTGSGSVLSVGGWNPHWFQMEYGRISIISGDTRELGMSICVVLSDMKDLWQLIMTSMQDHLLQDSKSFHQQPNSNYAKRQRWHQRCHLWGVLKKSQDWHTRCWRHCCERRTCWWKDGSEHAMVWCDERLPGAALPSPRPQTGSSQQVPPRHLRNTLIWWARSETLKKIGSEARISHAFRVSSFLCVSWCCNITYMQKVIQRSQPACPSLPWCSIFFYWSLHDQRLYKCESLFRVASCGQKKTVADWWVPLGSIN